MEKGLNREGEIFGGASFQKSALFDQNQMLPIEIRPLSGYLFETNFSKMKVISKFFWELYVMVEIQTIFEFYVQRLMVHQSLPYTLVG